MLLLLVFLCCRCTAVVVVISVVVVFIVTVLVICGYFAVFVGDLFCRRCCSYSKYMCMYILLLWRLLTFSIIYMSPLTNESVRKSPDKCNILTAHALYIVAKIPNVTLC